MPSMGNSRANSDTCPFDLHGSTSRETPDAVTPDVAPAMRGHHVDHLFSCRGRIVKLRRLGGIGRIVHIQIERAKRSCRVNRSQGIGCAASSQCSGARSRQVRWLDFVLFSCWSFLQILART